MDLRWRDRVNLLKNEVQLRRKVWYDIRKKIHRKKIELLAKNYTKNQIRKDREYKNLIKQKKRLAKEIRHIEKKINRAISKHGGEEKKKNQIQ